MESDITAILVISGMAIVTYLTRAGGLFLVNRIQISDRVERFLTTIPGAILISIIAPSLFNGGFKDTAAGCITMIIAFKTKNLFLAMISGIILVYILRNYF